MAKSMANFSGVMQEGEKLVECSNRKAHRIVGAALVIVGGPAALEPLIRRFSSPLFIVEFFIGVALLAIAFREFVFCPKETVCVTNKRLIWQRVDWLGKAGRIRAFSLSDVSKAKLCQTAKAWTRSYSGEVLITLKNGKQFVTPLLENGQFILDAIGEERTKLRIK